MLDLAFIPGVLDDDDWLLIWSATLIAIMALGAGSSAFRWLLGARMPEIYWRERPARPIVSFLLLVFILLFPCYFLHADLERMVRLLSNSWTWREFSIGWGIGSLKVLVAALAVMFINRHMVRSRASGLPEISGLVASIPKVRGELGAVARRVEFELTAEDGSSWFVESDVRVHSPAASLAAGYTVRRIASTQEPGTAFGGLKQGERVWILGARPVPGEPKRVIVAQPEGVVIRGGILAARTSLFPLIIAVIYVIMYVIPFTWNEVEWLSSR